MTTQGNRLEGKVAIVTGAGATGSGDFVGIGQAISLLFTRQGAKVLLVDRDPKNAEVTLSQIKEEGGEASVFVGDVTDKDACQAFDLFVAEDLGAGDPVVFRQGHAIEATEVTAVGDRDSEILNGAVEVVPEHVVSDR